MPCSECIFNVKVDYLGTIIVIEHSCAGKMIAASGEPECLMLSRDARGAPRSSPFRCSHRLTIQIVLITEESKYTSFGQQDTQSRLICVCSGGSSASYGSCLQPLNMEEKGCGISVQ
jgi:hypothetical protein